MATQSITTDGLINLLRANDPAGTRTIVFDIDEDDGTDIVSSDTDSVNVSTADAHETWDGTRDVLVLRIMLPG